jgi:hypothetical protein
VKLFRKTVDEFTICKRVGHVRSGYCNNREHQIFERWIMCDCSTDYTKNLVPMRVYNQQQRLRGFPVPHWTDLPSIAKVLRLRRCPHQPLPVACVSLTRIRNKTLHDHNAIAELGNHPKKLDERAAFAWECVNVASDRQIDRDFERMLDSAKYWPKVARVFALGAL